VALVLAVAYGSTSAKATVRAEFRVLFGLGAAPALLVAFLCMFTTDSAEFTSRRTKSVWQTALANREFWRALVGSGMGWFLYDFVYYGTALNLPLITQRIFGEDEGEQALASQCWENIALNLMGLPGVVLAIWQLRRLGTKRLQSWGFVTIAASCLLLAAVFKQQRDSRALLFAAACVLIVSLNWGCNVSTYVLPAESYPAEVRSSFFGLSAAMGKFGAIAGTATFQVITAAWGFSGTFVVCAAVSLVGVLVTQYFVEPYGASCRRRGVEAGSDSNEQQLERANVQVEVGTTLLKNGDPAALV
jgi:sugar phosphate permease